LASIEVAAAVESLASIKVAFLVQSKASVKVAAVRIGHPARQAAVD
jgi:hypothetical protein